MNLQDEMIDRAGKQLANDIDREILWSMLQGIGWHRVMLPNETAMLNATLIKEWLSLNCKQSHERHCSDFLFEDSKDANWFKLRWGTV